MKFFKYILVDNCGHYSINFGYVEYHRYLASTEDLANGRVKGGGMFRIDHEEKKVTLYGSSDDFGYPDNIGEALSVCYKDVKYELSEFFKRHIEQEVNLDEYQITYFDKNGEEHIAEDKSIEVNTLPPYIMHNRPSYMDYLPMRKGKNSKNQVAKDLYKKKKKKRKEQKLARRRK